MKSWKTFSIFYANIFLSGRNHPAVSTNVGDRLARQEGYEGAPCAASIFLRVMQGRVYKVDNSLFSCAIRLLDVGL